VNISITQRISDAQTKLVALRDDLTRHLDEAGDEPDETALVVREELNGKIETAERNLASLEQAEKRLASTAVAVAPVEQDNSIIVRPQRPFAVPAEKLAPGERSMRTAIAIVDAHARKISPQQALVERFGDDGKIDEGTRTVFEVLTRAASAPATTTTSGWASQLVQTDIQGFMGLLMPASVLPGLRLVACE
jgi:hypothetical protein